MKKISKQRRIADAIKIVFETKEVPTLNSFVTITDKSRPGYFYFVEKSGKLRHGLSYLRSCEITYHVDFFIKFADLFTKRRRLIALQQKFGPRYYLPGGSEFHLTR